MSELKLYFQALLDKYSIVVERQHEALLESFLEDSSVKNMHFNILNTQKSMIDNWMERTLAEEIKASHIAIPNGTVGKYYECTLGDHLSRWDRIKHFYLEIDEKLGLHFDKTQNVLSGTPVQSGDYSLSLKFSLVSNNENNYYYTKLINLIINPDPKSLWQNTPTPTNIEYYKLDESSSSFENFVNKKLVIASKRGRSHAHEAKPRDDAFDFFFDEDRNWGVIAVADGAGSAKYSRRGSELACEVVINFFKEFDDEKFTLIKNAADAVINYGLEENHKELSTYFIEELGKAAFTAHKKIREEAQNKGVDIRDFSTTLLFALILNTQDKYVIATFWVGDGGIGLYTIDKNEVIILGTPDSGEYAGQTRFLTMNDIFTNGSYAHRIKFKVSDEFTSLILMTDGITDPKFQTDANLNNIDKWHELWQDLNGKNDDNCKVEFTAELTKTGQSLLSWLDFWSPGNHDDRTIAILF